TIYLMSGVKLSGRIKSFDKYSLVLETNNQEQLIFKHAISTVVVSKSHTGPGHGHGPVGAGAGASASGASAPSASAPSASASGAGPRPQPPVDRNPGP
ncbi:MAG: RNA chaperone Hfq, partial [bacterium]|nr:RNA chaperone Hfq [bacterium]